MLVGSFIPITGKTTERGYNTQKQVMGSAHESNNGRECRVCFLMSFCREIIVPADIAIQIDFLI